MTLTQKIDLKETTEERWMQRRKEIDQVMIVDQIRITRTIMEDENPESHLKEITEKENLNEGLIEINLIPILTPTLSQLREEEKRDQALSIQLTRKRKEVEREN